MEKTVTSIVILFVWCVYSIMEGVREAYYYDAAMRSDKRYSNIHWVYLLQRGLFLFIIGITMDTAIFPISLAFIFPFIHDGSYYAQRNDIDIRFYPKRFKADSTTSTAFFEFSYIERIGFAVAGIIFFVAYIFLINL